jgi:carboxylesterase type B
VDSWVRQYSPSNNKRNANPHRGAFLHGSNSRPRDNPNKLSRLALSNGTPMIHVSIQYRVGALGFASSLDLSTESHRNLHPSHLPASGNYGLIDQRNAFLWIQKHIQSFGGDPNSITAFGISAGSASIHYHILSNDPPFDRAILMSGAAPVLGPLPTQLFDQAWEEMCSSLNLSSLSISEKLEKLRSLDPMTILKNYTRAPMGPMADGVFLLLKWDVFAKQKGNRCKSIILGDTKHDGIIVDYISSNISQPIFLSNISKIFTSSTLGIGELDTFLSYFNIHKDAMSTESYREALRYFFSVLIFQYPNLCIARSFSGKVYLYHFDELSVTEGMTKGLSYHGQCAMYLFQNHNEELPDSHVKLAVEMGKTWMAFASRESRPWEEFGRKERFRRFGGGEGKSVLVDVRNDSGRDYDWLEWLDGNREATRSLFIFAMEMVECKLLKQGQLETATVESARI